MAGPEAPRKDSDGEAERRWVWAVDRASSERSCVPLDNYLNSLVMPGSTQNRLVLP